MSADSHDYARHLQAGVRVRVGVPLSDGSTFQEWAEIASLKADVLSVDLSRDSLPPQARMEAGRLVQVGLFGRARPLGCKGEIAEWKGRRRLVLRLLDELVEFEPREFFRQDVCLPLDYHLPPSQFSQEIKEHWRQSRWAIEFAGQEPEPGESLELSRLREEIQSRLERRKTAPPVAANLSGNGMRLNLGERLHPGMLVELGIFLPQPKKVVEVVGEVVQVAPSSEMEGYNTALRYRFIDEADRDRLVGYIASQQLWELSQQAPKVEVGQRHSQPRTLSTLRLAIYLMIMALFFGWEVRSVLVSRERGEKHEIAKVFEAGIMEFLRQRR